MMNPACNYVHVALYNVGLYDEALLKVGLYDEPSL